MPMKPIVLRSPKIICLTLLLLLLFFFCTMMIVTWKYGSESNDLEALEAAALMRNTNRPRLRYNFLLVPSVQTLEPDKSRLYALRTSIIIVKSAYGNKDRRDVIRATWASVTRHRNWRFVTVFLVGKPPPGEDKALDQIKAEHGQYKDLLLLDVNDVPEHVPDKTLAGMQWVADFVPHSWIYSSADDDMSLHVPNFVRYIEDTISKKSPYILEDCEFLTLNLPLMCMYSYQSQDPPARDPKSKWYMSKDRYPPSYWPPYCRGGWYSMSVNLAGKLYETSRWMEYLYLDDVWITGLMRMKYVATVKRKSALMDVLLEAAPLSLRSERELNWNWKEAPSQVIVSHAWGNIKGSKVDVAEKLKQNWNLWSSSFPASDDHLL